nr:hypothetical protein [Tanacetum cinerariifolium]
MVVGECHEPNSEGSSSAWKEYVNARVAGLFLLSFLVTNGNMRDCQGVQWWGRDNKLEGLFGSCRRVAGGGGVAGFFFCGKLRGRTVGV